MKNAAGPLAGTAWANWSSDPIAGDASARSYARLTGPKGETVVLMNSGSVPTGPFCDIAAHLLEQGFSVPVILDRRDPFLVISDLGQTDIAHELDTGGDPAELYGAAVDVLVRLDQTPAPDLIRLTPELAGDMVRITADHYAPGADADGLAKVVQTHMAKLAPHPETLSLRDYHVENLIWRPHLLRPNRIGLLDFQDAFIAPRGYDLASLLRDVRRPVPDHIVSEMTGRFCAATGIDPTRFAPQLACLGAQRNLRILGVFARLIRASDKPKYAVLMPHVWRALMADLAHPALSEMRKFVTSQLPTPEQAGFA